MSEIETVNVNQNNSMRHFLTRFMGIFFLIFVVSGAYFLSFGFCKMKGFHYPNVDLIERQCRDVSFNIALGVGLVVGGFLIVKYIKK